MYTHTCTCYCIYMYLADDVHVIGGRGGVGVEGDATGTALACLNVALSRVDGEHLQSCTYVQ